MTALINVRNYKTPMFVVDRESIMQLRTYLSSSLLYSIILMVFTVLSGHLCQCLSLSLRNLSTRTWIRSSRHLCARILHGCKGACARLSASSSSRIGCWRPRQWQFMQFLWVLTSHQSSKDGKTKFYGSRNSFGIYVGQGRLYGCGWITSGYGYP